MKAIMLTQEYLKSRLKYEPETGHFYWLAPHKHHPRLVGQIAGCNREGYIVIRLQGFSYAAHRLAWLYVYGHMPTETDHINRDKADNRISNLRDCKHSENVKNHSKLTNGSGLPVGVRRMGKRYQARITCNGKIYYLGCFSTADKASAAYWDNRKITFGEFA